MLINPIPFSKEGLDAPLNDKPWSGMMSGRELTLLVDADMFVYADGFICEHSEPIAFAPDGSVIGQWKNKSSYNMWLKANPDVEHELDFYEWMESLDTGLMVLNAMRRDLRAATHGARQRWYLTKGSTLWRNEYATIQGYKDNRKDMKKPVYYDDLRQYMVDKFGAKILKGLEADDGVAALAREHPGKMIIGSGDKDLLTVPGLHINPGKIKEGVFFQSELAACRFLYGQMLTGDKVDNIKGLSGDKQHPGWGPVKARKAMEQFDNEYDMATFVAQQYALKYPEGIMLEDDMGHVAGHMSWKQMLVETANLLFLRRYEHTAFSWES